MAKYPDGPDEIRRRLESFSRKQGCLVDGTLNGDLLVFLWTEPRQPSGLCLMVSDDAEVRVYFAATNYGYFMAELDYNISMDKGKIDLSGPPSGKLRVPSPKTIKEPGVDYDYQETRVIEHGKKDNCILKLEAKPDHRQRVSRELILQMQTSP